MPILIITEKTSQARDLRAALGDRFGQILPAEGHLLRLAEPHEVEASWKTWACVLLKPDGLYPTRPANEGNKPAKLKAIATALERCDRVILATDCDREGQLIGQEILEHLRYRGTVQRALFTAQDVATALKCSKAPTHVEIHMQTPGGMDGSRLSARVLGFRDVCREIWGCAASTRALGPRSDSQP